MAASSRGRMPGGAHTQWGLGLPLAVVCVCACLKAWVYTWVPASFASASMFTLATLTVAAVIALVAHQPWRSNHFPKERDMFKLALAGAALAFSVGVTTYALTVMGAVRTLLLEHMDMPVFAALGLLIARNRRSTIVRGVMLAVAGAVLCTYYDPSQEERISLIEPVPVPFSPVGSREDARLHAAPAAVLDERGSRDKRRRADSRGDRAGPIQQEAGDDGGVREAVGGNEEGDRDEGQFDADEQQDEGGEADEEDAGNGLDADVEEDNADAEANAGRRLLAVQMDAEEPPQVPAAGRRTRDVAPDEDVVGRRTGDSIDADVRPGEGRLATAGRAGSAAARLATAGAARVMRTLNAHTIMSVVAAAILLTMASWAKSLSRSMQKTISSGTGMNVRRCYSIVLAFASVFWAALVCIQWALVGFADASSRLDAAPTWTAFGAASVAFALVALLFAEYTTDIPLLSAGGGAAILPSSADSSAGAASRVATSTATLVRVLMLIVAFLVSYALAWWDENPSPGTLLFIGGWVFTSGVVMVSAQSLDHVATALARAHAPAGSDLPGRVPSASSALGALLSLVTLCTRGAQSASLEPFSSSTHMTTTAPGAWRRVLRHVWEDSNSRKIFLFLSINFMFMFVEITVGWMTNSLGLISDAGHMFFDNASLFIGLYASYMARWKADGVYTYGYARYEVLAGFVNAIFLVFVAVSVVFEAIERLWEPPEIHGEHLLTVSVMGFLVNMIGLVFFHDFAHGHSHAGGHGHSHGGADEDHHGHAHGGSASNHHGPAHSATNENMHGVFLHVLADALGSLGVIVSSLLIKYFGWYLADPVASLFISILILLSVIPLIQATVGPLVQRVPESMEHNLQDVTNAIMRLPDVEAVEQVHFWKHHADVMVGTLHVRIKPEADPQKTLRQARAMLLNAGVNEATIQIQRDTPAEATNTAPSQLPAPISR